MNRWIQAATTTIMAGLAASSFFLVTFNTGWILRELNEDYIIALLICTLIVPLIIIILANLGERVRRFVLIAVVATFETCSYVIVTTMQNAAVNTSYNFYLGTIIWYTLMLGSALSMMMITMVEFSRITRAISAWPVFACGSVAMPCLIMAAILFAGFSGWVQNVLLAMILVPAALLIYMLVTPAKTDPEYMRIDHPDQLRAAYVVHPLKGGILTLFMIVSGVNIGLLVGLNGIGLDVVFIKTENHVFYLSMALGAVAGLGIIIYAARRLLSSPGSVVKDRDARVFLLVSLQVSLITWIVVVMFEAFIPKHHGTWSAQVIDGMVVGLMFSLYLAVVLVFHPPRWLAAYMMLSWYAAGVFYMIGQMLKAIAFGSSGLAEVQPYVPWVFVIELVFVVILVLMAAVPYTRRQDPAQEREFKQVSSGTPSEVKQP